MMPVVFKVPGLGLEIPGYGLALMIGFLLSIMWAVRRAERSGANPDVILNCGFLALLGGVGGSRLMYVWHYWDQFALHRTTGRILWAILDVRKGGLEVYGGFIAVTLLVLGYLWWRKHSIRWYLDVIAPSAALGMAIGRIGCFLNGCCFGGVCELPWAVRFPYGSPPQRQQWTECRPGSGLPQQLLIFGPNGFWPDGSAASPLTRESLRLTDRELAAAERKAQEAQERANRLRELAKTVADAATRQRLLNESQEAEAETLRHYEIRAQMKRYGLTAARLRDLAQQYRSLPVHPTQLYSTITLGLLAGLLATLYWRRSRDGQVVCTLLLIEPWTRYTLELLRADNPKDTAGFTISQFLAILLSLAGLIGLVVLRWLPPRSPRARLWEPPPAEKSAPRKS